MAAITRSSKREQIHGNEIGYVIVNNNRLIFIQPKHYSYQTQP